MSFPTEGCFPHTTAVTTLIAIRITGDARETNEGGLYQRWDKAPVSEKQIWAVVLSHPETFVESDGRVRLMMSLMFRKPLPKPHGFRKNRMI